jgi:hypothetical protein
MNRRIHFPDQLTASWPKPVLSLVMSGFRPGTIDVGKAGHRDMLPGTGKDDPIWACLTGLEYVSNKRLFHVPNDFRKLCLV